MINIETKEDFNRIKDSEELSCIKFGADWCSPCKVLGNTLDEISKDNPPCNIFECNIENVEIAELASELGISNIPFMVFTKKGEIVDVAVGVMNKNNFINMVKKLK